MRQFFRQFIEMESLRRLVFRIRLFYFVRIRGRLRTADSENAFKTTVSHNLKALADRNLRMELLIKPLSVIESVPKEARILIIGPRNEYDLLLLAANGFGFRNLTGLDLITYSPRIDLGDMHALPYPDGTFDVVLCGWTLSYSATPHIAADEMARVTKNGGVIGIGVEYNVMTEFETARLLGYSIQETERLPDRVNSADHVLALFGKQVGAVFFRHDAPLKISHTAAGKVPAPSNVAVIFSVSKSPSASLN